MYYNWFINDENSEFDPMSIVVENATEHLHELGPTASLISEYRKWQIMERYGLSFTAWCDLPKYLADMICEDSKRETRATERKIEDIKREEERKAKEMENNR